MLINTPSSYGLIARLFHLVMGIGITGLLIIGFTMTSLSPSNIKWQLYYFHKAGGVIILCLVLLRFLWRLINIQVILPADIPKWQKLASKLVHYFLYFFMFLMPISGILMSGFGGHEINMLNLFTIPALEKNLNLASLFNIVHIFSAFIFASLIGLHIGAGLYHHFIRKDNILIRIFK